MQSSMIKLGVVILIGIILVLTCEYVREAAREARKAEDKSSQIATLIESQVNTGGYTGCSCRSIGNQLVQCDMTFPAGTSRYTVIANTQGVADFIAQAAPLASTIYYTGYSGSQKICEFKYDMYSRTVEKKF